MLSKKDILSRLQLIAFIAFAIVSFVFLTGMLFFAEEVQEQPLSRFFMALTRITIGATIHVFFASWLLDFLKNKGLERGQLLRWFLIALAIVTVGGTIAFAEYHTRIFRPPVSDDVNMAAAIFVPNVILGFIVFTILEIQNILEDNKELQINLAKAEKDRIASQLSALQQKVNPHFMFNSLAVLSELIHQDVDKADEFISEFSNVYRYVLDLNDEPVVTVKQELEFLKSYLFLQKIRFGENLKIEKKLDEKALNAFIPPLSLQLLFENAIKHNQVSKTAPLSIFLKNDNGSLVVENSLNLRGDSVDSKGVGLKNLKEKYRLISEKQPEFFATDEAFVARIPLVNVTA